EQAVFGGQPSLTWHHAMPWPALSWILHACYGGYYLVLLAAPLFLYLRRPQEVFERGVFIMTLGLYGCFAVFVLFPVAGPRYFWGNATGAAASVLPARLITNLLEGGSAMGTAFPSSHVAATWCAVYSVWRDARPLALLLAPIAVGLALGTVYGQFHYAVDALAGAGAAILACALADPLSRVAASRRSP
ncbi:MAG: phosphatase PAP2 family protein, partial [Gemmatimonadales bacterium]